MLAAEVYAYVREQADSFAQAISTLLVRQGVSNDTAAFTSKVIIFLLAINTPPVLLGLALFTSVLFFFASFVVAILLAALLALTITLVVGFFSLSIVMSCALAVALFATVSFMAACLSVAMPGVLVVVIGMKLAKRRKAVNTQCSGPAPDTMEVLANPGPANLKPAREGSNSNRDKPEHTSIISDYSDSVR